MKPRENFNLKEGSVKGLQNFDSITTGRTPHKPLLPVHTDNDDTAGNLEQVTGAVPNESELVSMVELKQLILRITFVNLGHFKIFLLLPDLKIW